MIAFSANAEAPTTAAAEPVGVTEHSTGAAANSAEAGTGDENF